MSILLHRSTRSGSFYWGHELFCSSVEGSFLGLVMRPSVDQHQHVFTALSSGVGLFLCSSRWGGAVLQHQKWGGALLQISALELQQFCVKPFVGCQSYRLQIYWRLEERRDGAVSRVVSVFFCAVYIVLLGQCYVAMPSGYKLVITRALGLHGIYCTQPSGLAPSCFSAIYSIHPLCPCYNYNLL